MEVPDQSESDSQSESSYAEDEDDPNPITAAINAGGSLSEPIKASIAGKRKITVNKGKYK